MCYIGDKLAIRAGILVLIVVSIRVKKSILDSEYSKNTGNYRRILNS